MKGDSSVTGAGRPQPTAQGARLARRRRRRPGRSRAAAAARRLCQSSALTAPACRNVEAVLLAAQQQHLRHLRRLQQVGGCRALRRP